MVYVRSNNTIATSCNKHEETLAAKSNHTLVASDVFSKNTLYRIEDFIICDILYINVWSKTMGFGERGEIN
jgi:hypothetical protein